MASAKEIPQLTLQVRRTFSAPREKVFAAWADPEKVKLWMFKGVHSHTNIFHKNEIRPGGEYLFEVRDSSNGKVYWGRGKYLEVKPVEKISYTWGWKLGSVDGPENHPESPDTTVTVEFFARGNSTEVVLTHAVFHARKDFQDHNTGWEQCLNALEEYLQPGQ